MQEVIFWLVLLIICIGIEVATLGLTTIWFAGEPWWPSSRR